jgi:sec-independent protein translocase protein TatB
MFDIGWSELLVIAAVAIVVIGPKDLPKVMRAVGQWSTRIKGMARDFQGQFEEAIREAELDDVDKNLRATGSVRGFRSVDDEVAKTSSQIHEVLNRPVAVAKAEKAEKAAAAAKPELAPPAASETAAKPAVTKAEPAKSVVPAAPAAPKPPSKAVASGDAKP